LNRPFLATGIRINVNGGRLILKVENEVVTFDVLRELNFSSNESNIYKIDIEQEMVDKELEKLTLNDHFSA
jgi:ATP-dependent protease HslVU (ClpYQ) ATPase subunit